MTLIKSLAQWVLLLAGLSSLSLHAQLPPQRSTAYNGTFSGHVQFPAQVYAPQRSMTVEAWVYREDSTRCETILSQGYTQSFWFGFCGDSLRFYRSGASADAGRNVPSHRWTHVAAVYTTDSGGQVRFYLDGSLVSTKSLAGTADGIARPLYLGSDPGGFRFQGALDEVRLWSLARTAPEIQASRFLEITSETGLAASFPQGGNFDSVSGSAVSRPAGVNSQVVGILPRDLVVPRTPRNITRNGSPSQEEFEGSEKLVVRYLDGTNEVDAVASLIMSKRGSQTATNIWIGITFPELKSNFGLNGGSVRAYFDRDGSGDTLPGTEDLRFNYSAFATTPAKTGYRGNGTGAYAEDSFLTTSTIFEPSSGFCFGEFAPPCIEMSVIQSTARDLPSRNEIRFMLDFYKFGFSGLAGGIIIIPTTIYPAPFNASPNSPATWPRLRFGDFVDVPSSTVVLRAFTRERLPDGSEQGVRNFRVRVLDDRNLTELASDTTSGIDDGYASFVLTVPTGVPLRLEVEAPTGWEYLSPRISGMPGIEPTSLTERRAIFPSCGDDRCNYKDIFFIFRRPPGPVTFTAPAAGTGYSPEVVLREGASPKIIPPSTLILRGTNLHSQMDVYASDRGTLLVPSGSDPEPPGPPTISEQHYFPVPITGVSADGTEMTVLMDTPTSSTVEMWIRDNWNRPERTRYWHRVGNVPRTWPPYELLHGFEFENMADGHDIDDYRAAFPDMVCDPFKMVGFWAWFPIYILALDSGECVGMVSTSDQFSRWRNTEPFDPLVHFATGFSVTGLRPARFHTGNPCSPTPLNVWGQIRANHGVQMGADYIGETLAQLNFVGSIHTDMADQYAKIRANPRGQIICFRPGIFDGGHAVLALETRDAGTNLDGTPNPAMRDIIVYDPNWPEVRKVLHLDIHNNRFHYDGFDPVWSGKVLLSHDIEEFWERRGRNLITLDSLGATIDRMGVRGVAELFAMLVSGSARPMVTTPDGGQIGRAADGSRVETADLAVSLPVWGHIPGAEPGPSQIFMKLPEDPVKLDIHVEGKNYAVNTMHLGTMYQLFVEGGASGEIDQMEFTSENGTVNAFNFIPENARSKVTPRIALAQGGSNYVAALSWDGLSIPGGKGIALRALVDEIGAEFENNTGNPLQPRLILTTPSMDGIKTNEFGPFSLPDGSSQSLLLATPDGTAIRAELDLDRDGNPDQVSYVTAGKPDSSSPPALKGEALPNQLILTWELQPGSWILEQSTSVGPDVQWSPVMATPEFINGAANLALPITGTSTFFRLRSE